MNFHEARAAMLATERELVEAFDEDLGADVAIADDAAAFLLAVLLHPAADTMTEAVGMHEDGTLEGDVAGIRRVAHLMLGVRVLRAARGARAVLVAGYELESRPLERILVELAAHRHAIEADPSGSEALAWVRGERRRRISDRVADIAPDDLYRNLSQDSHGDPVGVTRLVDPADGQVELSPRRTPKSRAALLMHAFEAHEQAVVIARSAGIALEGADELSAAIADRMASLDAEFEGLREEL